MGDSVRVDIYDNRVEISNPGRFRNPEALKDPLTITRFARNLRIARTCSDLGYSQEIGEGIKRIFYEMNKAGLNAPVYEQKDMHVILHLRYIQNLSAEELNRLPKGSEEVLIALRSLGGIAGTGELATYLGVASPTVRLRLKALENADMVKWQGKSENDPRATWKLRGY